MGVQTPDWVREAVFYQIFPDRFARSGRVTAPGPLEEWDAPPTVHGFKGGDLFGIAERLDYLADLGVNALYLNPIFSSAANHRYHTYDYLAVDPLLGGGAAFAELIAAAHDRQMRVVLDGVFNHTGRGFWAFHHVLENGRASPYREWFHVDQQRLDRGRPLDPYPTAGRLRRLAASALEHRTGDQSLAQLGYRAWWDLPGLPKLDVRTPQVRAHLLEVAEHWIRAGADGWRLDVPEEIDDPEFWAAFRGRVKDANPDAYLVGEIWRVRPEWCSDTGFDGLMNYPLASAIIGYVAGEQLDHAVLAEHHELAANIRPLDGAGFADRLSGLLGAYDPAVVHLNLLGTHDTPRLLTMCGGDRRSVQLAYLLLLTLPGAPSIYYGDEIGMVGRQDPGCRAAFPWQAPDAWDTELRRLVRDLIAVRRRRRTVRDGELIRLGEEGPASAFLRSADGQRVMVGVNPGSAPLRLALPSDMPPGWQEVLRVGEGVGIGSSDGRLALELGPRSGVILEAVG